ncbi:dTDP-4-dehydrorhamnose 3,5-epimerase [Sphingomonas sp. AX6]|uniref:dTDP-4-dehydrorhamnose 3,5-epimerase n=1 Tax=Sphingomonas sp. AX6 TaxID=2653171 RepID=UPI001359F096|nr:dTDP-4-dehydrorhamnose 3,5-epimerase [Sphingomonas sp. AX6]
MSGSVEIVRPRRYGNARGWFSETYSQDGCRDLGIDCSFVQDNHSYSATRFTLRGLHFQSPPFAQDKLVRCVRGRIFDVAVDIRRGASTFGEWVGAELSAENGDQMFVPTGFAHGFLTLEPDTEVIYKCSAPYSPQYESGLRWDDPNLAIEWPLPGEQRPELSPRDRAQPTLKQLAISFDRDDRRLAAIA